MNDIKEFLDELGLSPDVTHTIQAKVFGSLNDKLDAYKDSWQVIQSCKDRIRNFDSAIDKFNESIDHIQEKINQLQTKRQEAIDKRLENINQLKLVTATSDPVQSEVNEQFRSISEW